LFTFALEWSELTEQMIRGLPYNPLDKQLIKDRLVARQLMHAYNQAPPPVLPDEDLEHIDAFGPEKRGIMAKLCSLTQDQSGKIDIEPPFYWYVSCLVDNKRLWI